MAAQTRQQWIEHIQREVNFSQEDLDANRSGQYGDRQRIKLEALVKRSQPSNTGCQRAIVLVMLLILFSGLVILNTLMNGVLLDLVSDPAIMFIVGVMLLIIVIYLLISARTIRNVRQLVDHIDKLPLEYVEGVVQARTFGGGKPHRAAMLFPKPRPWIVSHRRGYRVSLGGNVFIMRRYGHPIFLDGATYRLYYVKFAFITFLLSAELLEMPVL